MTKPDETFNCYYTGQRVGSNGKISIGFSPVHGGSDLSFIKGKHSVLNIGAQYPVIKTECGKYMVPSRKDILVDEQRASLKLTDAWTIAQRADLQIKQAMDFKPHAGLEHLVDRIREARKYLSNAKQRQFDAWLIKEICK